MASLVAAYGSDEDVSDDDGVDSEDTNVTARAVISHNLLISQDDSDSTDSDPNSHDARTSSETKDIRSRLPNPMENKLPGPALGASETSGVTSVFVNPFEQAELAKHSVLEQHVRMTEKAPERGTKKICWKFKKGKCHMGKNCRYFHDQDNISGAVSEQNDKPCDTFGKQLYHNSGNNMRGQALEPEPEDDDNYMAGKKRENRVGVSNHLVPPKKALSALEQQRHQERPWTVQKHN